jgi:hypothetical protein
VTVELRAWLRNAVSDTRRARAAALVAERGCDSCDFCGVWIDPKPRKRFCSQRCQKRWSWYQRHPMLGGAR